MRVYLDDRKISIIGKPWQIKLILQQYSKEFTTVFEWINAQHDHKQPKLKRIK